jgi:hypothetical protein
MTNCWTINNAGTSKTIGHQLFMYNAIATVSSAKPTYIGLRVKRYGPAVTRFVAGRMGIMLVRFRRNRPMLLAEKAAHSDRKTAAMNVLVDPKPIGSGHRRFMSQPIRIAKP